MMLDEFKSDFISIISEQKDISSKVIYIKKDDASKLELDAIIQMRNFGKELDGGRVELDNAVCFVSLDFEPKIYDVIKHDGCEYKIMKWVKHLQHYKLILENNARPTGLHTHSRFR